MVLRRRSLIYKLLLLVPAVWLCAVLLFATRGENNESEAVVPLDSGSRDKRDAAPEEDSGALKVRKIEGFGPPMDQQIPESMGGGGGKVGEEEEEEKKPESRTNEDHHQQQQQQQMNMPKPKKFVVDADSPIYKQDDPTQAGEGGKGVTVNKNKLTPAQKKIYDEGLQNNAFNQYASDMISIHRSLPSTIDKECLEYKYAVEHLPDTSVIVCFHNEAWSVLLRTFHSILERTPEHLLNEIILVDDFSDKEHTKKPLDDYVSQFPKVKVLRMEKREGLIRARLKGAAVAKGKVLTYLDSHCECMDGWLEPLLDRIHKNSTTVVCPVIDVIDDNTFEYHYSKAYFTNVGGFDWSLQFNWHAIPERHRKGRKATDPVKSPTMAGGLFAIDRAFFEKLGTYDSGFDIWGGENLELSFKTWMCGGRLEIVPCSHVGHIFRKRSPYKWRSGVNVLKRNSIRLAEVWLDEYKTYYYERINNNLGDFGDVSDRTALRDNLKCKTFKWYLDNIYPELFVPGDSIAKGEVRNLGQSNNDMCLDSAVGEEQHNKEVTPYPCHLQGGNQIRNRGGGSKICLDWSKHPKNGGKRGKDLGLYWCHNQGGNQYWMLSKDGEIRRDESCVDYAGQNVVMFPCHGMKGNQEWRYHPTKHQLLHKVTNKCLEMSRDGAKLLMTSCDASSEYQQWVFKHFDAEKARKAGYAAY